MDRQRTGRSCGSSVSADGPQPRPVHAIRRGSNQSGAATRTRSQLAARRQRQRTRTVCRQAAIRNCPRPGPRSQPAQAVKPNGQRLVQTCASTWPARGLSVSRFTSAACKPMSSFDPTTVRKAVEEFTPPRPQKFQDLLPAKEVITELRQKRASYRSIADLLTQHCLPTSKTAIAVFCHQVLGESIRPRRRPGRKRACVSIAPNGEATRPESPPASGVLGEPVPNLGSGGDSQARTRGPRIAQVRVLKPQSA